MKSKSEKEKIELKKRLARILRFSGNKICSDCPEKRPTWISFIKPQQNFALGSKILASFVCLECAGLHRKMGTHICVVRSISHDQFDKKDVDCADYSGNDVVNEIFEGHLQKSTMDGHIKPLLGAEVARRERFIRQKYVDLYFYRKRAHYQHIAEVNKMIANSRKPSKSKDQITPVRKKLSIFLHDENSTEIEKDANPSGCSTTVGNTTSTLTNTSRTRTTKKDRDDSTKSSTHKSREKKSSKKRSSKSGTTSTSRKKAQKKSSSNRRLKSKDQTDPMAGISSNIVAEVGSPTIGETSAPQKQPNIRKDLKMKSPMITGTSTSRRNSKDTDVLSGMILVFDEESCESFDSPQRERRRSSRDLDRGRRSSTIYASSSTKPTTDPSNNQNDHLKQFNKKPLVKSTSESCESRDPLATSLRDVRRSRSEITIDEITKKREVSISPGLVRKQSVSKTAGPSLRIDHSNADRYLPSTDKAKMIQNKSSSVRKLNAMLPLQEEISQLKTLLRKDKSRMQSMSARNLKNPYLESLPVSVEGILSEETSSYGFGDNTINNMSGTGENDQTSNLEENGTEDGFRVIDSEDVRDRSSSGRSAPWEDNGSFSLPFKNKKATDGAIKNQSGRRCNSASMGSERKLSRRDEIVASLNRSDDYHDINKSNRSIINKSNGSTINKSNRSISNKSNMSISNKSNRSTSNKSNRSISNKSNISINNDEPIMRINPRRSKKNIHAASDSPPSKMKPSSKKRSKKARSKSSKSEKKLSLKNQALLEEWEKLRIENEKKFLSLTKAFHNSP